MQWSAGRGSAFLLRPSPSYSRQSAGAAGWGTCRPWWRWPGDPPPQQGSAHIAMCSSMVRHWQPTPDTHLQPFGKPLPRGGLSHAKQLGEKHHSVRLLTGTGALPAERLVKSMASVPPSEPWCKRVQQHCTQCTGSSSGSPPRTGEGNASLVPVGSTVIIFDDASDVVVPAPQCSQPAVPPPSPHPYGQGSAVDLVLL
jgi:hypothetical protein